MFMLFILGTHRACSSNISLFAQLFNIIDYLMSMLFILGIYLDNKSNSIAVDHWSHHDTF